MIKLKDLLNEISPLKDYPKDVQNQYNDLLKNNDKVKKLTKRK